MENKLKEHWKTPRDWTRTEQYYIRTLQEQCYHLGRSGSDPAVIAAKKLIPDDVKSILDVGSGSIDQFAAHADLGRGMDFHWLQYADNSFDLIWARHALEHSPMPFFAILEWKRVAKKYILIIVPEATPYIAEYWGHWTCLVDFAWRALFGKAGLRIIKEETGEWVHYRPRTKEPETMMEMRFLCQK